MFDPGNFTPYYVDGLCSALSRLGVEVSLATSPPLFEPCARSGNYGVDYRFSRCLGHPPLGFLRRHMRLRQAVKALSYPAGVWRTWKALCRFQSGRPAVFHLQWALLPVVDGLAIRSLRARGWGIVYTVHEVPAQSAWAIQRRQLRSLLDLAHAIIVHTPTLAGALSRQFEGAHSRIHVVPLGSEIRPVPSEGDQARARQTLRLKPSDNVLLCFGMIKPHKGLHFLLEALPAILKSFPNTTLLVAGEPLMNLRPVQRLIDRLRIRGAVDLRLGFVPQADAPLFFQAADLVVVPYTRASASAVVAQAQSFARPVVATAVGALPEFVEEPGTGFLVPPASAEALADAVCRALGDRDRLRQMGMTARARLSQRNNWTTVAEQTCALYRQVLASIAPRG
jgi:glycosyltransferase involved in cell wall biosynthesis